MTDTTFATFLQRNKDFAARHFTTDTTQEKSLAEKLASVKALIIGCADMRVDPAHVLGLELSEAVVLRNIGGRVVPGTLRMMGMLAQVSQAAGTNPGGGNPFNLIVLQHTDCGITRLGDQPAMLANYFEISPEELKARAISDPRAAVAFDVAMLRATPALPANWLLSGLVYDVLTGLIDVVVPPAPLRSAASAV
ncbi:carbonic anhydrase [Tengunoibacter tsumagoiensis]|uniref:carbonic anhydrase n=1 Tax=Tengunoibacter tsumagoiensis TaxID=2014871 RepID=A0A402A846_9CHLR|nr:carbonic anhydrase [Tengunoibacter tsumagoiensis]GCE15151.1 carbonic anhydrase [Tengunoibacter tsumagoiensis]